MARILIVEDEVLIAMLLEDIVTDLGHHPVGPAMRLQPALAAAEHEDFDSPSWTSTWRASSPFRWPTACCGAASPSFSPAAMARRG